MWCTGGSKNAAFSAWTGFRLLMQREGLASEGGPCYYQAGLEAMALPAGLVPCQTLCGTSKSAFLCFFLHSLAGCIAGGRGRQFCHAMCRILPVWRWNKQLYWTCLLLFSASYVWNTLQTSWHVPIFTQVMPLLCFAHLECWRIDRFIF